VASRGRRDKGSKSGGQALAEVNGVTITTEDFKKELENLPPYLKPMADTVEGKKEMLDTMVIRELISSRPARTVSTRAGGSGQGGRPEEAGGG